jgi:serine/threonine protein kinase
MSKTDSLLTRQLDEYRLLSLLGRGGMARVYLGLDVRLRRYVAIKVIDLPHRGDPEYVRRFEREAQAVAQLEHPHIVRLYRYGEVGELLYMAMQYIEGADLGTVLATYSRDGELLPQQDAFSIVRDMAQALDYAHSRGVIHRDIKPSNIMLDKDGRAILTDFGLALFAEAETQGEIFGTPQYTAPEQVMSSAMVVPQSDLYSVGVILYEMFTGQLPFDDDDPLTLAVKHVNQTPPPPRQLNPTINPEVEQVILTALAKRPEERYQTGAELAEALSEALQVQRLSPVAIPPAPPRLTVPERVTTEYEKEPLPPLPPELATSMAAGTVAAPAVEEFTPVPLPPPTTVSHLDRPLPSASPLPFRLTPLSAVLGCATILFFIGLIFTGSLFLLRSLNDADANGTPSVNGTPVAADPTIPVPTGPTEYNQRLLKNGADSLFLVNVGDAPFPLAPLRLGDGDGAISGSDWEAGLLQRGSCVTAWQDEAATTPTTVTCVEVGGRLERSNGDRFWDEDFTVYYSNQPIGVCPQDFPECLVTVTVIPATTP